MRPTSLAEYDNRVTFPPSYPRPSPPPRPYPPAALTSETGYRPHSNTSTTTSHLRFNGILQFHEKEEENITKPNRQRCMDKVQIKCHLTKKGLNGFRLPALRTADCSSGKNRWLTFLVPNFHSCTKTVNFYREALVVYLFNSPSVGIMYNQHQRWAV